MERCTGRQRRELAEKLVTMYRLVHQLFPQDLPATKSQLPRYTVQFSDYALVVLRDMEREFEAG